MANVKQKKSLTRKTKRIWPWIVIALIITIADILFKGFYTFCFGGSGSGCDYSQSNLAYVNIIATVTLVGIGPWARRRNVRKPQLYVTLVILAFIVWSGFGLDPLSLVLFGDLFARYSGYVLVPVGLILFVWATALKRSQRMKKAAVIILVGGLGLMTYNIYAQVQSNKTTAQQNAQTYTSIDFQTYLPASHLNDGSSFSQPTANYAQGLGPAYIEIVYTKGAQRNNQLILHEYKAADLNGPSTNCQFVDNDSYQTTPCTTHFVTPGGHIVYESTNTNIYSGRDFVYLNGTIIDLDTGYGTMSQSQEGVVIDSLKPVPTGAIKSTFTPN